MTNFRKCDVVKHSKYPFDFEVLESSKKWVKCQGKDEHGEKIVKEFSPDSLKLIFRNPENRFVMNLTPNQFNE